MPQTAEMPRLIVEAQPTWSHDDVVAHRLAVKVQTLCTVKTPIESSLDNFFEETKPQDWAIMVKKLALSLPHGHYTLKPEFYGMLKPEIYPFEEEADRDHVINMVKEYQQATETQGLVRRPRNKRNVVTDSDDDEDLHGVAKKVKPDTGASVPQESASEALSDRYKSGLRRSLRTNFTLTNSLPSQTISGPFNVELESDYDLELKTTRTSIPEKEIERLKRSKSKLRARIETTEKLKSRALRLQRKASKGKQAMRNLFEKSWARNNEQQIFNQGEPTRSIRTRNVNNRSSRKRQADQATSFFQF